MDEIRVDVEDVAALPLEERAAAFLRVAALLTERLGLPAS